MSSQLSAGQLKTALNIRIKIDELESKIKQLNKQLEVTLNEQAVKNEPVALRKVKVKAQREIGRVKSRRGSLKKLLVKVFKKADRPLRIDEIYNGLKALGYKTSSGNPKRQLSTRLYADKSLSRPAPGTFALK